MGFEIRMSSVIVALFGALIVSGCAAQRTGQDFTAMSRSVGSPKAGHARIVVLREKGMSDIIDLGWEVKLSGEVLRGLKTGTYVYADRPAGHHQLTSTQIGFPGETKFDITASAGRTYFFLAQPSERAKQLQAAAILGGLSGAVVGTIVTSGAKNPGPLEFSPLQESAARAAISDLRLAE